MMNLDKISSQFDLKDLDTEKLISLATVHQKSIIKIVLIAGTFMVGGMFFNDFHSKDQAYRAQMSQMQEKLDSIKERGVALGELAEFKSSVPSNLSESQLITLISQYSKLYQISILSLLPGDTKNLGLYDLISVSFDARSDSFKNILLFSRKIERSRIPLRIDSWSGKQSDKGGIDFSIKVSAVLIHT